MWQEELAVKLREKNNQTEENAVASASGYKGKIEKVNPLVISICAGDFMYEQDDILVTNLFKSLQEITGENKLKVGQHVLCVPVDTLNIMAVIDRLEE